MKQNVTLPVLLLSILFSACTPSERTMTKVAPVSVIAFGSCAEQDKRQPVLERVVEKKPDLFIYLGDNIYGDTKSIDTLVKKYNMLGALPEFQQLKRTTPLLATWDDHDFGWNDIGRHYELKHESKKVFLDFFGVPDSTITMHDGIYYSKMYPAGDRTLQVIMLDLRTFRDMLLPYNGNRSGDARFNYTLDYSPYTTSDSTMMGAAQWAWLEQELRKPADIRIIGSSTQFGITHNGYEAWANFPHEQAKMIDVIRSTRASGVMFITGDVHYAEISKLVAPGVYPLYDVTASGITSTWDFATPNDNRVDGPVMENHFGLLTIDWEKADPSITMEIHDVTGKQRISRTVALSELQFAN